MDDINFNPPVNQVVKTVTVTPGMSGEARIAAMFADEHEGELMHVCVLGWHYYDGKRWVEDKGNVQVKQKMLLIAQAAVQAAVANNDNAFRTEAIRCQSSKGVNGALDLAAVHAKMARTVDDLDADPYLLNVKNGTIDLRTLELLPHRPGDNITKMCNATWDENAKSEDWERFLSISLADDGVRNWMQAMVGVSLVGKVIEQVVPVLLGPGANGKSVFQDAIAFTLGDYAGTADPNLLSQQNSTSLVSEMDLLGKRWVSVSETERGQKMAEAKMKRLSGGDRIKARPLYGRYVEFDPSHTLCLATNHVPQVAGDSAASWRRLRLVPFDARIAEEDQDRELPFRLRANAEAILAWAIQGWRHYQDSGFPESEGIRILTEQTRSESDDVQAFLESEFETADPSMGHCTSEPMQSVWRAWQAWVKDNGGTSSGITSTRHLTEALVAKGFQRGRTNSAKILRGLRLRGRQEE